MSVLGYFGKCVWYDQGCICQQASPNFERLSTCCLLRCRFKQQHSLIHLRGLGGDNENPTKIANDLGYDITVLSKIPPKRGLSFNMDEDKRAPYTGEIVNLDCSISEGRPKPLIKWTKNGEPFRGPTENSSYELTNDNATISFSFVRQEDSGVYQCLVQNRAGTITGKVKLEVKG